MMERRTLEETTRLLARKATRDNLLARYSRYGNTVAQYLVEKAFSQGGLRPVLARVLRPLPLEDERMHEALCRFLATEGVDAFFARVESRSSGPADSPDSASETKLLARKERVTMAVSGYHPQISYAEPHPEDRIWRAPHAAIASRPCAESSPPQAPPQEIRRPNAPWNRRERRSGRDRRSGKERRSGWERRKSIELIFRNRRFGGQRRSARKRRGGGERRGAA